MGYHAAAGRKSAYDLRNSFLEQSGIRPAGAASSLASLATHGRTTQARLEPLEGPEGRFRPERGHGEAWAQHEERAPLRDKADLPEEPGQG